MRPIPEQLFAGGYAACFENALFHVSREARRHFADSDIEVVAQTALAATNRVRSCFPLRSP